MACSIPYLVRLAETWSAIFPEAVTYRSRVLEIYLILLITIINFSFDVFHLIMLDRSKSALRVLGDGFPDIEEARHSREGVDAKK